MDNEVNDGAAAGARGLTTLEVPCPYCNGSGQEVVGKNRVTADMASDAGDPSMEGMFHSYAYGPCEACDGAGTLSAYAKAEVDALIDERDSAEHEADWQNHSDTCTCASCRSVDALQTELDAKDQQLRAHAEEVARLKAEIEHAPWRASYMDMRAQRDSALARLHAVEADRWQPIETAPIGVRVLVIEMSRTDPIPVAATRGKSHGRWHSIPGAYQIKPTHWMPLPSPPLADRAASLAAPAQEKK